MPSDKSVAIRTDSLAGGVKVANQRNQVFQMSERARRVGGRKGTEDGVN